MTPNDALAHMLGEIKLMEKKLAALEERKAGFEDRIKAALRAGDREAAQKLAVEYERLKDQVTRAERVLTKSRDELDAAKARTKETLRGARAARTLGATAEALQGMNRAMDLASSTDEMLRKLDEEAAVAEARLEIATERADEVSGGAAAEPEPPASTAEDILKEFEQEP